MELWDIYTADKQLTGRTMRRDDWNMGPDEFHLSVTSVIHNGHGQYLITQRSADKPWGALDWEFPGGGVNAGETGYDAAAREAAEETGLALGNVPHELIFSYSRSNAAERNNYHMNIYLFEHAFSAADVHVQESEVAGFMLATKAQLLQLGEQGKFMHFASMKEMIERL